MSARSTLWTGALAALALAACGDDERVSPVGGGGGDATSSSVSTTSGSSSASTGTGGEDVPPTPIREVFQRDPFGNVAAWDNLLWDGDFEWESAFNDQYGWLEGFSWGLRQPVAGPECRSGLKCAKLGSASELVGMAMASATSDLYASVWVRPTGVGCGEVEVTIFTDAFEEAPRQDSIEAASATPDAGGWCHLEGVVPQRRDKTYVLIAVPVVGATAIVDDVVLRPAAAAEVQRSWPRRTTVPTPAQAHRVERARELVRKHRGPHEGAPDPVKDALVRHGRGDRPVFRATPRVGGAR